MRSKHNVTTIALPWCGVANRLFDRFIEMGAQGLELWTPCMAPVNTV
jgi:hypothetical protein